MAVNRIPRIAEVFEDLATEVTNEIVVLEDFLNLNPDVTVLPNIPPAANVSMESKRTGNYSQTMMRDQRATRRRISRVSRTP